MFARTSRSWLLLVLALMLVAGCTKPRLDTSNAQQFRASMMEVRDKLPADARAAFDAALRDLVAGHSPTSSAEATGFGRSADSRPPTLDALGPALRQQLHGRTGREVIAIVRERDEQREAQRQRAEARARELERRQTLEEIRALRATLDALDLETLRGLAVTRAQLVSANSEQRPEDEIDVVRDWFDVSDFAPEHSDATAPADDDLELPMVELELESQIRNGIYAVLFEVELLDLDTAQPWHRFQTKQRFSRGLFYGQSATRRFTPKAFVELFGPDARERPPSLDSLVVAVRPVRLFGAEGQAFAGADVSDAALAQAQVLVDRLERSRQATMASAESTTPSAESASAVSDRAFVDQAMAVRNWRDASIARAFKSSAEAIRAELRAAEEAREPLFRFRIEQPRFFWSDNPTHRKPVIELRVRNNTGEPISWCHCRGRLTSAERERPWVDAPFEHRLSGNLAPGETRDLRIVPNWLGPWGSGPKDRDDLKLEVEVTRLIGEDRQRLFDYEVAQQKIDQLRALEAVIAKNGW